MSLKVQSETERLSFFLFLKNVAVEEKSHIQFV